MPSSPGSEQVVLASASPRRRELLAELGVAFRIEPADINESLPEGPIRQPECVARWLARAKAEAVATRFPDETVLAADTIVVLHGRVFGKPAGAGDARQMLAALRGRTHQVITGVAVSHGSDTHVRQTTTQVTMRAYSDADIEAYIRRGEPFDKAGGYAIQDEVFSPVERIDGCYCNVVGLPLAIIVGLLHLSVALPIRCQSCPLLKELPDS